MSKINKLETSETQYILETIYNFPYIPLYDAWATYDNMKLILNTNKFCVGSESRLVLK